MLYVKPYTSYMLQTFNNDILIINSTIFTLFQIFGHLAYVKNPTNIWIYVMSYISIV